MKKFEVPSLEVESLECVDVICTSCDEYCSEHSCPDDLGIV